MIDQAMINGMLNSADGTPRFLELCTLGIVTYTDDNGTRRSTSFFRIFNPARQRFMRASDDDEFSERDFED